MQRERNMAKATSMVMRRCYNKVRAQNGYERGSKTEEWRKRSYVVRRRPPHTDVAFPNACIPFLKSLATPGTHSPSRITASSLRSVEKASSWGG